MLVYRTVNSYQKMLKAAWTSQDLHDNRPVRSSAAFAASSNSEASLNLAMAAWKPRRANPGKGFLIGELVGGVFL